MSFTPAEPFRPARGLGSPHLQTLFAALLRPRRGPSLRRQRWDTPDGDFLDVDVLEADPRAPHLIVLHGLEGSTGSGYVAATLKGAGLRGWGAWALNFRSCSGEPNRLARSYHSGETADPLWILEKLRAQVSGPLFGVGFSLGGNVLLKLLAETGEACRLTAAAAISVPFDLQACARAMDGGGGWMALYRGRFLKTLKEKSLAKARTHGGLDQARIRAAHGIEAFDDAVTAPLHGFSGASEYYQRSSSGFTLDAIARPTLILSAADDPLAPAAWLPPTASANPHLTLLLPERGGHVGFVAGTVLRPRYWGEQVALEFLDRFATPVPR